MATSALKVAFCGGGNASHVGAAAVSMLGHHGRILTRRPEAFSSTMKLLCPDGEDREAELDVVSADPAEVVGDADIVMIGSPVNAYHDILESLAPHVKEGAMVGVMFSQAHPDLMIKSRIKAKGVVPFAMQYIPWQAKTIAFGSHGHLVGAKMELPVAVAGSAEERARVNSTLETLFEIPVQPIPFISTTITTSNQILHPARYYTTFQVRERERERERDIYIHTLLGFRSV